MSQRLKAGLSWPGFAVSAGEPFEVGPEAVSAASTRLPFTPRPPRSISRSLAATDMRSRLSSWTVGVGQDASRTTSLRLAKPGLPLPSALQRARMASICSGVLGVPPSRACGVGHEPEPLPDVRCADAVCAEYDRPAGVAFSFQV